MKEWVGRGASIEEAIAKGLQELSTTRENVDIQIFEQPKRRLLGIAKTDAVVRLIVKANEPQDIDTQLDGMVWVEDGQVRYKAPAEGGLAPRLYIDKQLIVIYQGKAVEKSVELHSGIDDLIIIFPENVDPSVHTDISVDKDGLTANLHWSYVDGIRYSLADQPKGNAVQLRLKKQVIKPVPPSRESLREAIEHEGIKYGIDLEAITPEALKAPHGTIVVARGKTPVPPQNATIDYVFQKQHEVDPYSIKIDHYEVWGISSIEEGAILATKTPARAGTPGIDVYGNPISVPQPRDLAIKCGKGVKLSEDGLTAIAAAPGLPHLSGNTLEVLPILELKSDADISTGNITFDGAIIIHGSVLENVKVESLSGNVQVGGLVSGAVIHSQGSILVNKNVVSSMLQAGGMSIVQLKIAGMLHNIGEQLRKLERAYRTVTKHGPELQEAALLTNLVELKFPKLLGEINILGDYFSDVAHLLGPDIHEIVARLMVHFGPKRGPNTLSLSMIDELAKMLEAEEEILAVSANNNADIRARYLQNSRLEASGSVIIEGQGAYYSSVIAGKGFQMERGVFRGGDITVNNGNIVAKELGGPTGVSTHVNIVSNGHIKSDLVHSNVTIDIAQQRYRFDYQATKVRAFLSDGILTIHADGAKLIGD